MHFLVLSCLKISFFNNLETACRYWSEIDVVVSVSLLTSVILKPFFCYCDSLEDARFSKNKKESFDRINLKGKVIKLKTQRSGKYFLGFLIVLKDLSCVEFIIIKSLIEHFYWINWNQNPINLNQVNVCRLNLTLI